VPAFQLEQVGLTLGEGAARGRPRPYPAGPRSHRPVPPHHSSLFPRPLTLFLSPPPPLTPVSIWVSRCRPSSSPACAPAPRTAPRPPPRSSSPACATAPPRVRVQVQVQVVLLWGEGAAGGSPPKSFSPACATAPPPPPPPWRLPAASHESLSVSHSRCRPIPRTVRTCFHPRTVAP